MFAQSNIRFGRRQRHHLLLQGAMLLAGPLVVLASGSDTCTEAQQGTWCNAKTERAYKDARKQHDACIKAKGEYAKLRETIDTLLTELQNSESPTKGSQHATRILKNKTNLMHGFVKLEEVCAMSDTNLDEASYKTMSRDFKTYQSSLNGPIKRLKHEVNVLHRVLNALRNENGSPQDTSVVTSELSPKSKFESAHEEYKEMKSELESLIAEANLYKCRQFHASEFTSTKMERGVKQIMGELECKGGFYTCTEELVLETPDASDDEAVQDLKSLTRKLGCRVERIKRDIAILKERSLNNSIAFNRRRLNAQEAAAASHYVSRYFFAFLLCAFVIALTLLRSKTYSVRRSSLNTAEIMV